MYARTQTRLYGSGYEKHLQNRKIFQPVFRRKPNKIDPESSKITNHESPETKVKQLLDHAFENTKSEKSEFHKNHSHQNNIQHSIPPTTSLNPLISAKVSGVNSQPKKKRKKSPKKETVKKASKKKKASIFDNY